MALPVTIAEIDRMSRQMKERAGYPFDDLEHHAASIENRMFDELATKQVYTLGAKATSYLEDHGFGHQVATRFPSAIYDIDEATKCLAFDRSTAAVFHLMRAMETTLKAVHACLGLAPVVSTNKNWGLLLGAIKEEIKRRGSQFAEKQLFADLHALLDSVKDAWRNGTMHVDDKKTESEAEAILFAVTHGDSDRRWLEVALRLLLWDWRRMDTRYRANRESGLCWLTTRTYSGGVFNPRLRAVCARLDNVNWLGAPIHSNAYRWRNVVYRTIAPAHSPFPVG